MGESRFGDKFYYYVFFEKITGNYPDSTSAVRPTWEFAGSLTLQDFILLGFRTITFLNFRKIGIKGFKLFSEGELKENVEEGSDSVFKSSKVLIMITLLMYFLSVIGAVVIDNRIDESETFVLGAGEDLVIELVSVHTISWQIKVLDAGENSSYSMLILNEFNCDRFKDGSTYSSEESLSKEDLVKSSAINPKRVSRENYCAVLISDGLSESSIELKYTVSAE